MNSHRTRKSVSFNCQIHEEKELLDFVLEQADGNFNAYVKTILKREKLRVEQRKNVSVVTMKNRGGIVFSLGEEKSNSKKKVN